MFRMEEQSEKQNIVEIGIIDCNVDPTINFNFGIGGNYFAVSEGVGYVELPLVLSGPTEFPAYVLVNISSTVAIEGSYYNIPSIYYPPLLQTNATLRAFIIDNNIHEPNRTVNITLPFADYLFLGTHLNATIYIEDNDPIPTLSLLPSTDGDITLSSRGKTKTEMITIDFDYLTVYGVGATISVNGTAIEGTDYSITDTDFVFAPLATNGTITINTLDRQTKSKAPIYIDLAITSTSNASYKSSPIRINFDESYKWGLTPGETYAVFICGSVGAAAIIVTAIVLIVRHVRRKKALSAATQRVDSGGIEMSRYS